MSRNDLALRIGAALVAIVAIGLAAATVRSPIETGGSGGSGGGSGSGTGTGTEPPPEPDVGGEGVPQFFEYLVYALLIVIAIGLAWYFLVHRREFLRLAAVVVASCIVLVVLIWLFVEFGPEPNVELPNGTAEELPEEGGGDPGEGEGDGDVSPISITPLLGVLGVITAIFVGALVLTNRQSDEDDLAAEMEGLEAEGDAEQAAVGEAAGRAATRIEATDEDDVDNEVFRAWEEMTGLLEVDRPETSTPREFADAAIDAGLARHHVEDLTRLFEDVRYGGAETTDEMEERAVSVLRQIETEYAGDGTSSEQPNGGAGAAETESGGEQQ